MTPPIRAARAVIDQVYTRRSSLRLLLLLVAAACGSGEGPTHWNKQPLETFEGTTEDVTFTIQLPKGMQITESTDRFEYGAEVGGKRRFFAPRISISKSEKQTLEEAIKRDTSMKAPSDIVFKEETADGWVYALENDPDEASEDYIIRGQKHIGDVTLRCWARVFPMKKGGKAKDDIPLVAKMCQSLQTK
jgi:hypothetical protein